MKHYIKLDGNGGINISGSIIALISLLLVIISMVASSVFAYGRLNEKVTNIEEYFAEAGPRHTEIISNINSRLNENNTKIAIIETKLDIMCKTLEEINLELKEIKKELKE